MTALRITAVDHVTVTAPEELADHVVTWYREVLGLQEVDQPEGAGAGGGWLKAGEQQVHVSVAPQNPPEKAHFCLVVEDFDAAVEGLRAARCHIEQARAIPGRRRFFTRDPAGNRIEIMAWGEG
jgi:catechol 2,3-dioxygenase-like lactoylglutathione lyase family enzyme